MARKSRVLLAAAAAAALVACSARGPDPGPLRDPNPGFARVIQPVELRRPFVYSLLQLRNRTEQTLIVDRVEPIADFDGLTIVEAYLSTDGARTFYWTGCRAECVALPASLRPGPPIDVILVMEVTKPGAYESPGLNVFYHDDDREYVAPYASLPFRICSPGETPEGCTPFQGPPPA